MDTVHISILCYLAVRLSCVVSGAEFNFDGHRIEIDDKDAKISLVRPDDIKLEVKLTAIQETDIHGNAISTDGHLIQMTEQNVTIQNVCSRMIPFSNVNSRYIEATSNLYGDVQQLEFIYKLYYVTTAGHIVLNEEVQRVEPGNVRLTLTLRGWKFCQSCHGNDGDSATGEFLDLQFELVLPEGGRIQEIPLANGPSEVKLGNDMTVYLSRKVWRDGDWESISKDFLTTTDHVLHIQVPRFDTDVMYTLIFDQDDENLELIEEDSSIKICTETKVDTLKTTGGDGHITGSVVLCGVLVLVVWFSMSRSFI